MRSLVSCIALASVLLGPGLAVACGSACAKAVACTSGSCNQGPAQSGPSDPSNCQMPLCSHLEAGTQTAPRSDLVETFVSWLFSSPSFRGEQQGQEQSVAALPALPPNLGPAVPPPLFTVLRA